MIATLILDCTECRNLGRADELWRQAEGLREWVADFDDDGKMIDPDLWLCPECGAPGRLWSY
jgi:hypothetical protein